MRLGDLSWIEVNEYLEKSTTLIIPLGTCEQHGKHLPLETDTIIAEYFSDYISYKFQILVAPTFSYGINLPCDKNFSGTVSLHEDTFSAVLKNLIEEFRNQGFKKFLFITAHGDPIFIRNIKQFESEDIHLIEIWQVMLTEILNIQETAKHAGEAETSLMLHLFPELVKMDSAEDFETPWVEFKAYLNHEKTEPILGSPGNQGYPSYATPEKGRLILDSIIRFLEKSISSII